MTKFQKILDILDQLKELCPELEHIATNDMENPGFIFVGDEDSFTNFAALIKEVGLEGEMQDVEVEDLFDEMLEDAWSQKLIGYDDNDDEGNGTLQ